MTPIAQLIAELRERASEVMPQSETGALLTRAAEALARQEELLAEAGKVVEPFAECAATIDPSWPDVASVVLQGRIGGDPTCQTVADFRAAARLSDKLKGE